MYEWTMGEEWLCLVLVLVSPVSAITNSRSPERNITEIDSRIVSIGSSSPGVPVTSPHLPLPLAAPAGVPEVQTNSLIGEDERCSSRLETALGSMSTRRMAGLRSAVLDLSGYALHQSLRTAPYDMYVTDMRLRMPGPTGWARVDRCRFDPGATTLQTRLMFRDLAVTGSVRLVDDLVPTKGHPLDTDAQGVADKCNMTLRMRRAGLGFTVVPSRGRSGQMAVTTATTFVEPQFVSVHAFGCRSPDDIHRRSDGPEARLNAEDAALDMTAEMEEIFMRGVRSLLTRYMEHQLEPALRDTLMVSMGYSLSYG